MKCVGKTVNHSVDIRRNKIIEEAASWLGTPFHHHARIKGVGVDCIGLLVEVHERVGLIEHIDLPHYSPDWMQHRSEERFLAGVLATKAHEVTKPDSGDVALFRYGRCYSHGAIVTRWPHLIHAFSEYGVIRGDATKHPLLDAANKPRPVKFYSVLG